MTKKIYASHTRSAHAPGQAPEGLDTSCGYRGLSLRLSADGAPASLDVKGRSVDVLCATETPVRVFDYERWEAIDEVLLMSGLQMPDSRQVVLLDSHYRGQTDSVIGSTRQLKVAGTELLGRAFFASADEGVKAFEKVREGHLTDFSIGYNVSQATWVPDGENAVINGRSFKGPIKVVTSWKIRELSICPIGADELAKARAATPAPKIKEIAMNKQMRAFLERQGLSTNATEEEAVRFLDDLNARGAVVSPVTPTTTAAAPPAGVDADQVRTEAIGAERNRVREIDAMCKRFDCDALADTMVAEGITVDAARAKVMDHLDNKSKDTPEVVGGFRVTMGADERDKFRAAGSDALLIRAGHNFGETKAAAGASELAGYTMREMARHSLVLSGQNVPSNPMEMLGRALTSSDLPLILGNTSDRSLQLGFDTAGETWQEWCATGSVSDFKTHKTGRLSETQDLEEIADGAPYKPGSVQEFFESYAISTYGRVFSITRQTLMNDDLGALTAIPMRHGEAAARKIGDIAYAVLTANSAMGDGTALFHANHANLAGTSAAVGVAPMNAAVLAMKTQKDIAGKRRLNIRPNFFIAPAAVEGNAEVFFRSGNFADANTIATDSSLAATRVNPYGGNYITRVYDPRLDDVSATAWYLAGPQGKTVTVFFLNGIQRPYLEVQNGWSVDGIEHKVRIDAGAKALDWRGLFKNAGA